MVEGGGKKIQVYFDLYYGTGEGREGRERNEGDCVLRRRGDNKWQVGGRMFEG